MGRAERPSEKKLLGRRGMYLGWSCMSWRHADRARRGRAARASMRDLVCNFGYLFGLEALEKFAGARLIEQRIGGFDAQKKPVPAGLSEARHVKGRMVRHRQPAQSEEAKHARNRCEENRHFKCDHDIRRPAMQRP